MKLFATQLWTLSPQLYYYRYHIAPHPRPYKIRTMPSLYYRAIYILLKHSYREVSKYHPQLMKIHLFGNPFSKQRFHNVVEITKSPEQIYFSLLVQSIHSNRYLFLYIILDSMWMLYLHIPNISRRIRASLMPWTQCHGINGMNITNRIRIATVKRLRWRNQQQRPKD